MKIIFTPKTSLGRWSIKLIALFFAFLGLFFLFVGLEESGGHTFFSNFKLSLSILAAGISGVSSFLTGSIGIIKNKERAIFVWLATLMGFFVLFWIIAEILFPH